MTSEIKVDTISEQTSANGVTIDGLTIKDGNIIGDVALAGTTPTFTIGDGGAEDAALIFDGNALDFHIALDDSADDLVIGTGSTIGSNVKMVIENGGNVGINETSPASQLHITGATDAGGTISLKRPNTTVTAGQTLGAIEFITADSGSAGTAARILAEADGTGGEAKLVFNTGTGGSNSTRMIIDHDGNVAIGTTSIDVSTQAGGSGYRVLQIENDEGGQINLDHNDAGTGSTLGQINFQRAGEVLAEIEGVTDGATDNGKINFRTQPDGGALTVRMTIDHDGKVGIGTSSPGELLEIKSSGDPGLRLNGAATGNPLIDFAQNGTQKAYLQYLDSGDAFTYQSDGTHTFQAGGSTEYFRISTAFSGPVSGKFSTFGEDAPDCSDGGLCAQIGSNDGVAISLKSSDVAHGVTDGMETDTYATLRKQSATKGGLQIRTIAEDNPNERLVINVTGDGDVTESTSTSTKGAMCITSSNKSGTGEGNQNANGNMLSIANYTNTRFLFEGNGEFHADASSNTFDEYEDAHLVRAYDLSHGRGVIDSKFDKFVSYNHQKLADLKLVGKEKDGTPNHFVNVTGFQRLHNGAIWQQYEKHQRLAEAVYEMAKEALGEDKADAILEKHDIKLLN